MKSSVETLNPTRVKLGVEVPFAELEPSIDKAIKSLSEQIQVPGFRRGKVPARLIEQRVGRPAIVQEAVNEALPDFYQQAVAENEIMPIGQPEVSISQVPGLTADDRGDLVFAIEVDVRPEIDLPELSTLQVEIEEPSVDDDAVEVRLEALRGRFGTLKGVDRPATDGDFISLDLRAVIGDEEVDSVTGVSYQIGEGNMLEGLDEALDGLSAGETTTFTAPLAGGDHAGQEATVTVTAQSVKERELPELDDEFAELASEFDTLDELKADLRRQAEKDSSGNRVALARQALLEKLLEDLEIPVPEGVVEEEIRRHLEAEGKEADDPHGEEIREDTIDALRTQFLLDELAQRNNVQVSQQDLMQFLVQTSQQYGMDPNTFVQALDEGGQVPMMVGEVARSKSLDAVLPLVTVVSADGTEIDLGLETPEGAEVEPAPRTQPAPDQAEPAAETATESVAETTTEPAAETATEPAAETATEPAAEATTAPVGDTAAVPAEATGEGSAEATDEELEKLTKTELQKRAEEAGVSRSGTKAEIIARLRDA